MAENIESLGLAVKYRPKSFQELIGQREIKEILISSIINERIPQQILFAGGSGLGKTTIARIYASMILCHTPLTERDEMKPCGACQSCHEIFSKNSSHPDLIEFDAASNGGKDEIREISQRAMLSPVLGNRKIYIIDEAHGLSNPGGQAFLKLLEEPPKHVVFMLCTTDPEKMLKTNRGRCIEFRLKDPTMAELIANLEKIAISEEVEVGKEVLKLVIESSDPELGVRGTVATLGKIINSRTKNGIELQEAEKVLGLPSRGETENLLEKITNGESALALNLADSLVDSFGALQVRKLLLEIMREKIIADKELKDFKMLGWYKLLLESEKNISGIEYFIVCITLQVNGNQKVEQEIEINKKVSKIASKKMGVELLLEKGDLAPELVDILRKCRVELDESSLKISAPGEVASEIAPYFRELKEIAAKLKVKAEFNKH